MALGGLAFQMQAQGLPVDLIMPQFCLQQPKLCFGADPAPPAPRPSPPQPPSPPSSRCPATIKGAGMYCADKTSFMFCPQHTVEACAPGTCCKQGDTGPGSIMCDWCRQ
jgi:hypothetical protein